MADEPAVRKSGSGNHKKKRSQVGARTTESPLPSNFVGPVAAFCPGAATPISKAEGDVGIFWAEDRKGFVAKDCAPPRSSSRWPGGRGGTQR